jgi:hypothetical protein
LSWTALHYLHPPAAAPLTVSERVWPFVVFALLAMSCFVQVEPAPYDYALLASMGAFVLAGTRFPPGLAWPALFLALVFTGYAIGLLFAYHRYEGLLYLRTSAYLGVSTLFFAALVWRTPERMMSWLMAGALVAGVLASCLALAGYLGVPGAEAFALFGRATGPFNDPNVFAPTLILPLLYLLHHMTAGKGRNAALAMPVFLLLLLGLFFSFSRGAWLNFSLALLVFVTLSWSGSSGTQRTRFMGFAAVAVAFAVIAIGWALSMEGVRALFTERFVLAQEYDISAGGRFASMREAFKTGLANPLGIGPFQWPFIWGLMPHNVYVNVFVSGGVISIIGWAGLTIATLWTGFNAVRAAGPFRPMLVIGLAVFFGHAAQGALIDTNHWRHLYVLAGVIWGLSLAARPEGSLKPA